MRTLVAILLALAVLPAADAQTSGKERINLWGNIDYKACEAKPRWLLVTVVEQETRVQGDKDEWKNIEEVLEISFPDESATMIDRCEISIISEAGLDTKGKARIHTSKAGTFTFYTVKESLQDICSVLPDCADATAAEDRP